MPKAPKIEPKTRRRLIRSGLIAGNVVLLVGVALFIWTNRSTNQTIRSGTLNSFVSSNSSQVGPLDQLSSAQIALTAARLAHLPEATAVRNQADSDSILLKVIPNDSQSVTKPELVTAGQKSRADIIQYEVQPGETIPGIANKLGVSADNIRWSNNITGNSVTAGTKLDIPPISGIIYTVKAGDTPAGLASRFRADEAQIISINDAEISGLRPGDKIIIPNGQIQAAVASTRATSAVFFTANYGGNGYDYGYCTWYVASQVPVPTNWGNANTWATYAAASGWTVSSTPRPGAIAQNSGGWLGHVALVHEVSPDGTMMKYSDMNGLAGWGRVGYSDWVPASTYPRYIYR